VLLIILCTVAAAQITTDESPADPKINRQRGLDILSQIKDKISERYYDRGFHGIDLDKRFKAAQERIKGLQTNSQIFRVIAQAVLDLDDSHTFFLPPSRFKRTEYGFSLQMIGDKCYVVDVKPGTDAQAQRLKVGDVVSRVGNIVPGRATLWKLEYLLYILDPQQVVTLTLMGNNGNTHALTIRSRIVAHAEQERESEQRAKNEKIRPELKFTPYKCVEIDADLVACRLYTFKVDSSVIDKMMKTGVTGHKKLILDLRSNPGGYVETEAHLTSYFFDHAIKIGTEVSRGKSKERIAKSRKDGGFGGDLAVLVDSKSASASELFARVVQIEKRGKVIGDVTAGKVMEGQLFRLATARGALAFGFGAFSAFGVEVTVADLVMSDGQRLEGKGVIPDVVIGPTDRALAEGADPILAQAVAAYGSRLSPEGAGKFHFITRVPEPGEEPTP